MSDDEGPKKKKVKTDSTGKEYEERIKAINVICEPLASKKSTKRIHKLVRKASGAKARGSCRTSIEIVFIHGSFGRGHSQFSLGYILSQFDCGCFQE